MNQLCYLDVLLVNCTECVLPLLTGDHKCVLPLPCVCSLCWLLFMSVCSICLLVLTSLCFLCWVCAHSAALCLFEFVPPAYWCSLCVLVLPSVCSPCLVCAPSAYWCSQVCASLADRMVLMRVWSLCWLVLVAVMWNNLKEHSTELIFSPLLFFF